MRWRAQLDVLDLHRRHLAVLHRLGLRVRGHSGIAVRRLRAVRLVDRFAGHRHALRDVVMDQETPGGVSVDGQVAEVWQSGRQVGTLWDWHLEGHASKWMAYASRQTFAGNFSGGAVEIRFLITASSEHVFQIRGEGQVTEFVTGSRVKHPCRMEGIRLWSLTAQLSASS
jgi:hypothetical protein